MRAKMAAMNNLIPVSILNKIAMQQMFSLPVDSANPICCPSASETANNTPQVIDGDDTALVDGVGDMASRRVAYANFSYVSRRGVHASHDTLVVAFEEYANEGKCLNSKVELTRREPPPKIGVTHLASVDDLSKENVYTTNDE